MSTDTLVYTPVGYGTVVKTTETQVVVQLEWGGTAYLQPDDTATSIPIQIKTFFGERKLLTLEWAITAPISQLQASITKQLELPPISSFKLLYPMGQLRELPSSETPSSLRLPAGCKLVGMVQQAFAWDESMKGNNIEICSGGLTVIKKTEEDYETVLGTIGLDSGRHYWEVKIDRYVNDEDIFIGVAHKDVPLYTRPPETGQFWGYLCTGYYLGSGKKFGPEVFLDDFSEAARTGDVIGVTLEFKNGLASLSFSKNNVNLGTAFSKIAGMLYPAVCLYYHEAQVTLSFKY